MAYQSKPAIAMSVSRARADARDGSRERSALRRASIARSGPPLPFAGRAGGPEYKSGGGQGERLAGVSNSRVVDGSNRGDGRRVLIGVRPPGRIPAPPAASETATEVALTARRSETATETVHDSESGDRHQAAAPDPLAGRLASFGTPPGGPDYLEFIAKGGPRRYGSLSGHPTDGETASGAKTHACGDWWVWGADAAGCVFGKSVFCGREWCTACQAAAHRRRIARWLPKAFELVSMGYLVVTIPPEDRWRYRQQDWLRFAAKAATGVIRRIWARGLRRYHYFGEQENAPDGKTPVYSPHLNFLVDGGYETDAVLDGLRTDLKRALKLSRRPVIHYQYTMDAGKKWHLVRYVTRPTFLDRGWNDQVAAMLAGFRNNSWWGKWGGPGVWCLADLTSDPDQVQGESELIELGKGRCPEHGEQITWHRKLEHAFDRVHPVGDRFAGGYVRLVGRAEPRSPPAPYVHQLWALRVRSRLEASNDWSDVWEALAQSEVFRRNVSLP